LHLNSSYINVHLCFRLELRVDEEDVGQRERDPSTVQYSSSVLLGKDTFEGCISNLYLRRLLFLTLIEPIYYFCTGKFQPLPKFLSKFTCINITLSLGLNQEKCVMCQLLCLFVCVCVFADLNLFTEQRT